MSFTSPPSADTARSGASRLWEFGLGDLALLAGVAVGYLLGGYVVFHYATRRARRLGVLGDY